MAVAFAGTPGQQSNNGANKNTTVAVPYPASIAAGELLLLAGGNTSPDPYTNPAGWTVAQTPANSCTDVQGGAWTKAAAGGETGTLTLGTTTTITTVFGAMLRYSGAASAPRTSAFVNASTATVTCPAPPALTGLQATDMVVRIYLFGDDASKAANTTATVNTTPLTGAGWALRVNLSAAPNASGQYNGKIIIVDKINGTDNPSLTSNATGGWTVISIAIPVAGAAPAGPPPGQFLPFMGYHAEPEGLWTPPRASLTDSRRRRIHLAPPRALNAA